MGDLAEANVEQTFLSPWWLRVLRLPARAWWKMSMTTCPRIWHGLVLPTGEFSARFLCVSLRATPLMFVFNGWHGLRWLRQNRRNFGVAAIACAEVQTAFHIAGKASRDSVLAAASLTFPHRVAPHD